MATGTQRRSSGFVGLGRAAWLAIGTLIASAPAAQVQTVNPAVIQKAPQIVRPPLEVFQPPAGDCAPLPALAGQNVDEVLAKLSSRLFRPRVQPEASSQPAGTILREPSTELIEGRLCYVDLAVSDGSLVRVPPLVGSTREEATRRLAGADLQIAVVEVPSEEPAGRVFKQRPDPEQVLARQSVVEVVIALPTLHEVPNVIGLQLRDAVRRLRGFTVGRNEVPSTRPAGEVTDQEPRAPVQLPARAEVRVDVSDGSLVRVPGVEQQPLDEARAELGRVDLQAAVAEREGDLAPGIVAKQDPPAGREVKRGSAVRLVVSTGIAVPDVVRKSIDDARGELERFNLTEVKVAGEPPGGLVLKQDPAAGTRMAAGSPVGLQVSDGSIVPPPRHDDGTGSVDDETEDGTPPPGVPWLWILGGLAAVGAGAARVRRLRKQAANGNLSYRARLETEPESVRIGAVAADGAGIRIAARFEVGESTVRLDGDSS